MNERIQNKKFPKLAKLKEDNSLECLLCKFNCKEEISFGKHLSTPLHKKVYICFKYFINCFLLLQALQEFQEKYEKKKKNSNNNNNNNFNNDNEEGKKNESAQNIIVGVKRPPETQFHIQEKIEIIDSNNSLNEENREAEEKSNKDLSYTLNIRETVINNNEENLEYNNEFKVNSSENKILSTKEEKEQKNESIEDEYDEKIAKALNKILEQEEDMSTKIKNNLKKFKQKNIDIENKNEKPNEQIEEENENIALDLFNWKKRKLF